MYLGVSLGMQHLVSAAPSVVLCLCCAFAILHVHMCCTVTTAEPEAMSQPRLRTTIAAVWAATADNGCRTAKEAGPSMHCEHAHAHAHACGETGVGVPGGGEALAHYVCVYIQYAYSVLLCTYIRTSYFIQLCFRCTTRLTPG